MTMRQAVEILQQHRTDQVMIVPFTGYAEWQGVSTRPELDIPFYGAMGKAGSTGLGLALARPDVTVWVADGDGSLLMNLGSLVTTAQMKPRNLVHMVLENGVYGTTGGQPIPGAGVVDFAAVARAAGFERTYVFDDAATMEREIGAILRQEGPIFITLKVEPAVARTRNRKPTKDAIRDVMAAINRSPAMA